MATCQSCGSELTGLYCNDCGARAQEGTASVKQRKGQTGEINTVVPQRAPKQPKAASTASFKPRVRYQSRVASTRRFTRTTVFVLAFWALLGAGIVVGLFLAQWVSFPNGSQISSSPQAVDSSFAPDLPPIVLAGQFMDQGVEYMQKNQRSAAADSFRKALTQYEQVLQQDPDNLYARSYLGLTYFYVGEADKALATEQEVLAKDPNYLWAIFNMAWMYETLGKSVEAALMYQKYLDAAPNEQQNKAKYAEQYELIDRQLEAARNVVGNLQGGSGQ